MLHAYRLLYPDSPHAPEMLWEWERLHIDRLLWNAKTFGRAVVQRYFANWRALAEENRRIWQTYYLPQPCYQLSPGIRGRRGCESIEYWCVTCRREHGDYLPHGMRDQHQNTEERSARKRARSVLEQREVERSASRL